MNDPSFLPPYTTSASAAAAVSVAAVDAGESAVAAFAVDVVVVVADSVTAKLSAEGANLQYHRHQHTQ